MNAVNYFKDLRRWKSRLINCQLIPVLSNYGKKKLSVKGFLRFSDKKRNFRHFCFVKDFCKQDYFLQI